MIGQSTLLREKRIPSNTVRFQMRNKFVASSVSSVIPGVFWAILGVAGFAEVNGFFGKIFSSLIVNVPLTFLIWLPLVVILKRWFSPTLPNILALSVTFWFCFQLGVHLLTQHLYNNVRYLGVSTMGVIIYFTLGILYGYVFWFFAYREKPNQ